MTRKRHNSNTMGGSPRKPQNAPFANQSSERLTEFEVNFYCREYIKKLK